MAKDKMQTFKYICITIILLVAILTLLVGCNIEKQIKVEYIIDGQTYCEKEYENKIELPDTPEKTGTYFDGWYIDSDCSIKYNGKNLKNQNSVKLYGKFIYNKYVIDYYIFNEIYSTEVLDSIDNLQIAIPLEKDGYQFNGWFLNDILVNSSNLKNYINSFDNYKIYANYTCLHTKLSDEFIVGATCTQDGMWCNKCLTCDKVFELRPAEKLGHTKENKISYNKQQHWSYCIRCDYKFDIQLHTLSNADNCKYCEYYVVDIPMFGSAITSLAKREDITPFDNIAGAFNGNLEMTAINIGQGDCIFIKFPDGKTMVMDSGSTIQFGGNNYDRLVEILTRYNVQQIDYLFITHSDYDHIRYMENILNDYQIKNVYLPKVADNVTNTYEDVIKAVAKETYINNGTKVKAKVRYNIGDFQIAGNGWRMRCYTYLSKDYPVVTKSSASSPTATGANASHIKNSLSPICLLEYAGRTIVLTGDSNEYNEKYLIQRNVFDGVDADILKVAHHGSKTSTTGEFLASVKCEYAILSYGTNSYGHPTSEVLDRLQSFNYINVYHTKEDGNITVNIAGNGNINICTQNETNNNALKIIVLQMLSAENYCLCYGNKRIYYI